MIFSKANLQTVKVASTDPFDRGLHGVRFEPDGTTVGSNGRVLMAVGPANGERSGFPKNACEPIGPGPNGVVMSVDTIEKVLQNMDKGKQLPLQHVCMSKVKDPARIGFTSVNAKGDPNTNASLPKNDRYPEWKKSIHSVLDSGDSGKKVRLCLNRKDLIELLKALESAAPDRGGINPVFMEITSSGLTARCQNFDTGQHAIGVVTPYNTRGEWLNTDAWEEELFSTVGSTVGSTVKKKVKKRPKRIAR